MQDMYWEVKTNIRTCEGTTNDLPITTGLHQGWALILFSFTAILDEITQLIHGDVPYCMLLSKEIVSLDESRERLKLS